MKILSISQIREADNHTIENEPISSVDLMERAASKCFNWILSHIAADKPLAVFCGTGNNGGDGLVIARLLAQKKRTVEVFIVRHAEKTSGDFEINYKRLIQNPKVHVTDIRSENDFPSLSGETVIIDAIFGSGLSKPVTDWVADLIKHINKIKNSKVIAIDIPSGLFGEDNSGNNGAIIKACITLTFQSPKLSFFFAENEPYVGDWMVLPIGLQTDFIPLTDIKSWFLERDDCRELLKPRKRFSHKGTYGHGLLISGSYGKMGAAVLASRAALRAGAGLISAHIPAKGYQIIQTAAPEVMASIDNDENCFSELPDIKPYNAIAIGPGIGTEDKTQRALKVLIQETKLPLIFDADAINILSENKTWLAFLAPNSILTPHPREFERLAGKCENAYDRWQKQIEFSRKFNVYVILKGAFTSITCPDGTTYFNSTGNPGMATGGSGDVLTGILLGLKAQGYNSIETCLFGAYLHGLAGDIAAKQKGQDSLIAGDITESLGKAWKYLR
jgi:ADP-dependent NAD(P)H-hydrate dehydratase / NAD(P)H-hydrate epimerase